MFVMARLMEMNNAEQNKVAMYLYNSVNLKNYFFMGKNNH